MTDSKKAKSGGGRKTIALNRKARHEFSILETITAGIVLTGTEVKSLRAGKVSITEAFARIEKGEIFLYGSQISHYEQGNIHNHAPDRVRKLLMTKKEIERLIGKTKEKGLTLVALSLYFQNQWVKVEIGLGKGKTLYDKRHTMAERDSKRQIEKATKQFMR
jgi:SsrA-binding protein